MVLASTVDIQVVEVTPSKSRLVYSTGEGPWRANEHEGEGETEGQGGQQKVAELGITGSDDGGVVEPNEDAPDGQSEEGTQGWTADTCRELEVGQEVKGLGMHWPLSLLGQWSWGHVSQEALSKGRERNRVREQSAEASGNFPAVKWLYES